MSKPSPEKDAETLHTAMSGVGTDENAIIKLLTSRSNSFRQQIKSAFFNKYNKSLIDELKSELGGNFEDVVLALFEIPLDYDVIQLHEAITGVGTDEDTLLEIISTRPGWVLHKIKLKYKEKYQTELEDDIKGDTSGELQKILLSLLKCGRSDNVKVDKEKCVKKAQELIDVEEGKWGSEGSVFDEIIMKSSPMELALIVKEYIKKTGRSIMEDIEKEFGEDVKELFETILFAIISPSEYFAKRIYTAMKGAGTNDKVLIRVIVSRKEIDLNYIKVFYKKMYNKEMVDDIKSDCTGDYETLLVELVGN